MCKKQKMKLAGRHKATRTDQKPQRNKTDVRDSKETPIVIITKAQKSRGSDKNETKKSDKIPSSITAPTYKDSYRSIRKSAQKSMKDNDDSQEKMSLENTLKEVPNRMPEVDLQVDAKAKDPIFTNDELI
ncbi:hypothetical protein QR680_018368 [Steinernema hermaphroditum]|uniref:Uncharacterized protein n=1 Tax=Steinernema hermaphroditum TaxID=289476 RepID=A0AA39HIJ7_9BILA|nr:hypothetical protein QR680_018368 [Steinernema hermaphroditum]